MGIVYCGTCIINHGSSWAWTRQPPWYLPYGRAVCAMAFVACMNVHKCCVMFLILSWRLCTGMDEARALVHVLCSSSMSCVPWPLLHVSMQISVMLYILDFITLLVHRHGRGTCLGTCLV